MKHISEIIAKYFSFWGNRYRIIHFHLDGFKTERTFISSYDIERMETCRYYDGGGLWAMGEFLGHEEMPRKNWVCLN